MCIEVFLPDNLSKRLRSKIMRSIKSKNTRPEIAVRSLVFRLGYRYRLTKPRLPGRPDLIFAARKKVIFVHGCFWHVHTGCSIAHIPNYAFWRNKLRTNAQRDRAAIKALNKSGWRSLVVWECKLKDLNATRRRIVRFLGFASGGRR